MNLITRDELQAKLERGDRFQLVMAHSAWAYGIKHIPRSVHVEKVAEACALLDPADEIVVYSAGAECAASIYAYYALERCGYEQVRRYAGGIADWEAAGCPLDGDAGEPASARRAERWPRRRRPAQVTRPMVRFGRPWHACA